MINGISDKREDGMGTCGDFKVIRYQGEWGSKTLMHFEKCPQVLFLISYSFTFLNTKIIQGIRMHHYYSGRYERGVDSS